MLEQWRVRYERTDKRGEATTAWVTPDAEAANARANKVAAWTKAFRVWIEHRELTPWADAGIMLKGKGADCGHPDS